MTRNAEHTPSPQSVVVAVGGGYDASDVRYGLHLIANEDCDEVAASYYAKKALAHLAAPAPSSLAGGSRYRQEAEALAEVLRSRGRNNSKYDINRAANLLDLLAALSPEAPAREGEKPDLRLVRSFLSDYAPRDVFEVWKRIEALTPRHEAPAEGAGNVEDAQWLLENYGAGHPRIRRIAETLLRARSSAPEAREGEAVAWLYTEGKWSDGPPHRITIKRQAVSPEDMAEYEITEQPLYTHPAAPSADKLRIAVEALERLFNEKRPGYHDCIDAGEPECAWCEAENALAALKAEGDHD